MTNQLHVGDVFAHADGDTFLVVTPKNILCLIDAASDKPTLYGLRVGELRTVPISFWEEDFDFFKLCWITCSR